MKRFLYPLLGLTFFAGMDIANVRAQFVHLKFESKFTLFEARGYQAGYPWDTGGMISGIPVTFDIYYDSSTPETSAGSNTFAFTDPSKNFFHVSADLSPYMLHLPSINITRPIDFIQVSDSGFDLTFLKDTPYEALDFNVVFASPLSSTHVLPQPQLPPLFFDDNGFAGSGFSLDGGKDMFRLPNPGFGSLSGTLDSVEGAVHYEFPPVPEPSTYGLGGLTVMAAAIGWRHRRKQKGNSLAIASSK